MTDYSEKRDFQRMALDCSLEYRITADDKIYQGKIQNLSAKGVLFLGAKAIAVGTELQITLSPVHDITPPMVADVRVTRCDKHDDVNYYVAGEILKIL
jgi:hypothetical protein